MKRSIVAFIAHPLNLRMASTFLSAIHYNYDLKSAIDSREIIARTDPFVFAKYEGLVSARGSVVDLIGVACPLLPDQFISENFDFVLDKVIKAVEVSASNGAQLAVLGGFTSVIGNEGEEVAANASISVTSGNSFTAALSVEGIKKAVEILEIGIVDKCVVVGASGDIGSACARSLRKLCKRMVLVGRDMAKLNRLKTELEGNYAGSIDVDVRVRDAVENADIVLTATSALTTIIDGAMLKSKCIVCDVSLPANVGRGLARQRPDILVFEGGLCTAPFFRTISDRVWESLITTNAVYGCLAEGLILGFENHYQNFSIGRGNITNEKMDLIMNLGLRHGLGVSPFFSGDKFYSEDDLLRIKNINRCETYIN